MAILELQEELEGKGLSRSIIDACLADRRTALTAQAEAQPTAPAAAPALDAEPAEASRCVFCLLQA